MEANSMLWLHLRLVAAALMWGGAFVAARFTVAEVPPFTAAFLRFALAAFLLFLLLMTREKPAARLRNHDWPLLIILGLTGIFGYNALFFTGLKYTTAINGSLITAINPVAITIIAAIILRETVTLRQVMGILVSLFGVALVITGGAADILHNLRFNKGDLIMLGVPLAWALYSVYGKKAMDRYSPLAATTYACIIGAVLLFPGVLVERFDWTTISPASWGAIAYMAVFASVVAFNWYYGGIKTMGAGKASMYINLVPLWTMLLAGVLLHEMLVLPQLLGAGLIITGVYLATYHRSARQIGVTAEEKSAIGVK